MGKKLSQLNSIDSVSGDEFLLVDGQNFLESKKIKIKDIKPYILSEQTGGVGQFTDTQGEIFNDYETNKALTKFSHSEGTQSVASCLGFKILNMTESGLGMRIEGDATALLDSSIIANRNDYGLENSISFQWGQNFDLSCNVITAEYSSSFKTTNVAIDKTPRNFDLSLATSGYLWVPLNPEIGNTQIGVAAHTEGYANKAIQIASHAEGYKNIAAGKYSHTEGKNTIAVYAAHSEGMDNKSLGICSHTEGSQNIATRDNTHAEGTYTQALFDNAHAEGSHTIAGTSTGGNAAHAEGSLSQALGDASHAEGNETQATANYAHSEGDKSIASGVASHAEGNGVASGVQSHAEGTAIASNEKAHAEGSSSKAAGKISHAEGDSTNANGLASHAEGSWTTVDADGGHSEGIGTVVSGNARGGHAEGVSTKAQQEGAHAEGVNTDANAKGAHAGGVGTVAILDAQTAIGRYNAEEWDGSLFVIGNGSAAVKDENGNITTPEIRSTIFKVKDNGDVILKSGLIKGVKTPIDNTDAVNKQYVDGAINNINIPTVVQEAGNSESFVMSQKAVTDLVSSAIGTTQYETVDSVEEMTDTTKSYILSTTGTIWTYGEVTTEKEAENKFVPSTASLNARLSGSSGSVSANSGGSFVTDFIAVSDLDSITPFNVRLNWEMIQTDDNKVVSYDSNKTRLSNNILNMVQTETNPVNAVIENGETIIDIKTKGANSVSFPNWANVAYLRFQLFVKPKGTSIISTDVENLTITFDAESGTITENKWYDTGISSGSVQYETVDSIEGMTDKNKSYVLSTDGYIYTYTEKTETVEHEAPNKFVASDAQINIRMGLSSMSAQDGFVWTGAIPVDLTKESPFRIKVEGTKITEDTSAYQKLWLCADNEGTVKISAGVLVVGASWANTTPLLEDGTIHADYKEGAKLDDSILTQIQSVRIGFKFSDSAIASTSELSGVKITFPCEAYTEEVTTSAWVSTGMKPSESGGGSGNYVGLLVKINDNTSNINEIDKRVTALETESDSVTIPSFWESAVNACISKIKNLQVGRNCVTFPFFSDNHQRNGYAGMLIAHIMKECNIPYCFFGGDSIDSGYIASESVMIAQDKKFDTMMSYVPNGRLCRAVGNHDGYWAVSADEKHYYTDAQNYELFLREESIAQNKHFGGDGTYYYIDDIASKVRWIVLDTNDAVVEAEQLSWLQNTAMSFNESGWAIVFISHQPISNHYHSNISNAAEVRTIVSNYINGSSSNKADVIGWFSGHIHRDRIYEGVAVNTTDDSIGAAMPFKQITITSDNTSISYDNATKHTVANDDKSHAIDFVTINKTTRTVNLTRLGIGEDRSYSY